MDRDRAWRRSQRVRVVRNRVRLGGVLGMPVDRPGVFAKRDPCDCGNARCVLCHTEKVLGLATRDDIRARYVLREARLALGAEDDDEDPSGVP